MFAPSEEGSKLREYRGFSGAQLGNVEDRGQVYKERHTRNSAKRRSTFPKQEYEQRVSNGRYLPASEAILMNTRMMQNTLECAIYVGALVKLQNSRKVTTLFHLCHGPDFRSRKTSMILLLSSLREITIRSI